jgi:hypothetical protein
MGYYVVTGRGKSIHVQGNSSVKTLCGLKSQRHIDNRDNKLPNCKKCVKVLRDMEIYLEIQL